jgi:hypothetical protein
MRYRKHADRFRRLFAMSVKEYLTTHNMSIADFSKKSAIPPEKLRGIVDVSYHPLMAEVFMIAYAMDGSLWNLMQMVEEAGRLKTDSHSSGLVSAATRTTHEINIKVEEAADPKQRAIRLARQDEGSWPEGKRDSRSRRGVSLRPREFWLRCSLHNSASRVFDPPSQLRSPSPLVLNGYRAKIIAWSRKVHVLHQPAPTLWKRRSRGSRNCATSCCCSMAVSPC